MMESYKEAFTYFIHQLQDNICLALEAEDGHAGFRQDDWEREGGGGGKTRILSAGKVFEKGGVSTSVVNGILPESMQQYLKVKDFNFFACGISIVMHPYNPFVPTVHANYRYFELYDVHGDLSDQWFAGGSDLTPYYLFEEDAYHFHLEHKKVCDRFDVLLYPEFKKACDQYFFNHHRMEARGIGGLFFDYLRFSEAPGTTEWFDFTTDAGKAFVNAYLPIVRRRKDHAFNQNQKRWQEIRRGRYVEFNLIHDKGTLFGLKTNGRIESILMSLPPTVRWEYDHQTQPGSEEDKLLQVLKSPRNWV